VVGQYLAVDAQHGPQIPRDLGDCWGVTSNANSVTRSGNGVTVVTSDGYSVTNNGHGVTGEAGVGVQDLQGHLRAVESNRPQGPVRK
jgi:hypothetical protein